MADACATARNNSEISRARGGSRVAGFGLLPALLLLSSCDSFDFGRVTGRVGPAPSATGSSAGRAEGTGAVDPAGRRPPGEWTLVLGGDIALPGAVQSRLASDAKHDPFAGLAPVLEATDLSIATLVSPLGEDGGARAADAFARSGFRTLAVGSDRLWAAGQRGFLGTVATLKRARVQPAGGGAGLPAALEPVKTTVRGTPVVVIASATWPDVEPLRRSRGEARDHVRFTDPERVVAAVQSAKKQGAVAVVLLGGSPEYAESPAPGAVSLSQAAVAAGADVVVGSGAHLPLGVALVAGHPVLYGLGNLLADADPKNPWAGRGFVAKIAFTQLGIASLDLCPILIVDGEPRLLAGSSRSTEEGIFERALERLSRPLGGVHLGEPDLHSCLRVTPRGK